MSYLTTLAAMETAIAAAVPSAGKVTIGPVGVTVAHPAISIMPGLAPVQDRAIKTIEVQDRVWWRVFDKGVNQRTVMLNVLAIAETLKGLAQDNVTWGGECQECSLISMNYDSLVTGEDTPLIAAVLALDVVTRRVTT